MTDTIPAWAVKGAKVAWVGEGLRNHSSLFHPVNGTIFTIRGVKRGGPYGLAPDEIFVALEEMHNPPPSEYGGPWWHLHYVRPLVTRTQDQDIAEHFKPLLDAEPPLVRVPHMGEVS